MSPSRFVPDPGFVSRLADRLDGTLADLSCERSCILVLIAGGVRAALVASSLDEALAEARRRRAAWSGAACASRDGRIAA